MKAGDLREVQRVLWAAADEMRANSSLAPAEYRGPVLGLVFLAYAEKRFDEVTPELQGKTSKRRGVTPDDYRSRGVLYVPDEAKRLLINNTLVMAGRGRVVERARSSIRRGSRGGVTRVVRGLPSAGRSSINHLL